MPIDLKNESSKLKSEVKNQAGTYIMAGFGLVASLAWNEAIKALIEKFFPLSGGGAIAKLIYALIMTLVVVILSVYLFKKPKEN